MRESCRALFGCTVCLALIGCAASSSPQPLTVSGLTVVDSKGNVTAKISQGEFGGGALQIWNGNGKPVITLTADSSGGGSFNVINQYGKTIATIGLVNDSGQLLLINSTGQPGVLLKSENPGGELALFGLIPGGSSNTRLDLTGNAQQAAILGTDPNGKTWTVPHSP
jgi:hypothetical protein